jgi:membrane protein implicated in regulation of membrane protease activity
LDTRNARFVGRDYREHLRTAVGSSAAPYGYTLATWTTGAALSHAYGVPTTIDALLFMLGAVLAFALVGAVAFGGVGTRFANAPREAALWGSFHFLSVGGAIGAATVVSYLVAGGVGWVLGPFASTTTYLLVLGAQFSAADKRSPEDRD